MLKKNESDAQALAAKRARKAAAKAAAEAEAAKNGGGNQEQAGGRRKKVVKQNLSLQANGPMKQKANHKSRNAKQKKKL